MSDAAIEVLHVGSASRDASLGDPRGWRLGGGVTYAALTTARLGLRTAAVVGADAVIESAAELDLLRDAGVELLVVRLTESPAFRNVETPTGRIQACLAPGHRLPLVDLPAAWTSATAWSLVPVAGEIGEDWASAVPAEAVLAVGWQGWVRALVAGRTVERTRPAPSDVLRRADLVGVSRHDLPPGTRPADLRRLLGPGASLLLTDGDQGGQLLRDRDGVDEAWRYEAVAVDAEVDPTGAGDTFLAALLAAAVRPSIVRPSIAAGDESDLGLNLAFAASAASLVVEGPGVFGVPDLAAVRARAERGRRGRLEASDPV
jgi:sugar/nucleoside kinase (ribokinase family)